MLNFNSAISEVITLSVNGSAQQFDSPISVNALIEHMQLGNKRIAVECNSEIVPRSQFALHILQDGDKLEIVVAVGGG